jgi:chromosome segregation ATPase
MSDLLEGQEPTTPQATPDGGRDYESEIDALRKEAAKWRTQYRDASGRLKELEPMAQRAVEIETAQKTEGQRLAEQLAALQGQVTAAQAAAQRAEAERKLTVAASKAGVPAEALQYLDPAKFDLDDEAATLEALAALAAPRAQTPAVGATNPARGANGTPSPAEWFKQATSGGSTFFD